MSATFCDPRSVTGKPSMNVPDLHAEAKRWIRWAEEDLAAARGMLNRPGFVPRHACGFAQQAAEKALKAVLVFLQIDFPKTHDLDELSDLIPSGWQAKSDHPDLSQLTQWSVEARYPRRSTGASVDDAQIAVDQAKGVVAAVRRDLAQHGWRAE